MRYYICQPSEGGCFGGFMDLEQALIRSGLERETLENAKPGDWFDLEGQMAWLFVINGYPNG